MTESLMWPFLTYVIDRQLVEAGKTRADFARALGVDKGTVTRMLDGKTAYARVSIDDAVTACAQVIGSEPIDLWQEALGLWGADGNGRGLANRRRALATRRQGQRRARRHQDA